jgi:RNA polymerase sigma factor (sigma-70 family)
MGTNPMSEVIQYLRSTLLPDGADLTDAQLLECFVSRREPAALEALVRRHGPMVWGVCRRLLGDHHDAEDAFQATFLVLVRKAAAIRSPAQLGSWLYGVARLTALKARATRAKRKERERSVSEMPEPAGTDQAPWSDLEPVLDQEVSCLPEKYRAVLVLCGLEGKTVSESARQLGCPEGTVASRLARARAMLERRLARHGLTVAGGSLAVWSEKAASAAVPDPVMASTIKAVTLAAAGPAGAAGVVSAHVVTLTEGVVRAMLFSKLKVVLGVPVVFLASVLGVSAVIALTKGPAEPAQVGEGQNRQADAEEQPKGMKEGQPQEARVRHPKRIEAVPMEEFPGRLDKRQGDSIAVAFGVDEHTYLQYQRLLQKHLVKGPGSPLYIGLADENGFPHRATLKGFDDRIDPNTGIVQAHATLPDPDRLLLPGMFVRVRLPVGPPQKGLGVPDEAVLSDQGTKYLLVVNDKDIVERRDVSLGAAKDDVRIIEKGVSADDWVVVGGLNKLVPGTRVKRRIVADAPKGERSEKTPKDRQNP